jgi:hypothetical protein
MVAGPRNQRYLQGEVVGFRRPLRLYGGPEHRRQIAPQLDLKRFAGLVWSEHNRVDEAAQGFRRLRPAVRLPEGLRELRDLRAVDPGHLRMQEWGRLLRGSKLAFQLFPPGGIRVQLVFHHGRRHAFHDHLDQLFAAGLDAFDLTLDSRVAGAMLHPQTVHLARELFTELLEQFLAQELLLERRQNSCLDLVTPDGEAVVARAFLAGTEACEPIAAGHDVPSAADAALRQTGEQILGPSCEADVACACDRAPCCALAVLRGIPELVAHYPEERNLLGDPLCLRIQPRDPLARVRILHVAQSVPDQTPDVELVVQDSSSSFRVPMNRAGTPRSSEWSWNFVPIQPPGNRFRCDSSHELPEDPFNNRGFHWFDFSLTSRDRPAAQRLHNAVAITESAGRLATFHAPAQASMRLVRKVLQEQRVHRSLEPDVQVRDVAFGEGDDVDAGEGEALEETGGVFLVAAEAVQ